MADDLSKQAAGLGSDLQKQGMDAVGQAQQAGMGAVNQAKQTGQGLVQQGQQSLSKWLKQALCTCDTGIHLLFVFSIFVRYILLLKTGSLYNAIPVI